ncbi:hypothetical protein E2C01_014426 [Portunus trituberculatus]|uniref:Uncharacterized protein n=1 Tax=Portunus trituberculatus TaxID=210409 RepID=A0A5B7DK45_PORTR|nr:hypothetical protein [Portunus trituberculatus]
MVYGYSRAAQTMRVNYAWVVLCGLRRGVAVLHITLREGKSLLSAASIHCLSPSPYSPIPGSQAASTSLSLSLLSTQTASYRLLINRVPPIFLPSLAAQTLHTNNIRHIADQNCQSAAASRSHQNDNSLIPHLLAPRQRQPRVTCPAAPFPPHAYGETLSRSTYYQVTVAESKISSFPIFSPITPNDSFLSPRHTTTTSTTTTTATNTSTTTTTTTIIIITDTTTKTIIITTTTTTNTTTTTTTTTNTTTTTTNTTLFLHIPANIM